MGITIHKHGSKFTWESQAGGCSKQKTGKIVKILEKKNIQGNHTIFHILEREFPQHKPMFDGGQIPGNAEVGYLIEVITSPNAKPRIYMPFPSKLKLVD